MPREGESTAVHNKRHVALRIDATSENSRICLSDGEQLSSRFAISKPQCRAGVIANHFTDRREIVIEVLACIDDVLDYETNERKENRRRARHHNDRREFCPNRLTPIRIHCALFPSWTA